MVVKLNQHHLLVDEHDSPDTDDRTSGIPAIGHTLDTHHLDNDTLSPLAVEFRVKQLFPRTQVEAPASNRDHDLMSDDGTFQVSVGIVLTGLVVLVRQSGRGEVLEPALNVLNQSTFPIIDIHPRRNVHCRHQHSAVGHSAGIDDVGNIIRNPQNLLPVLGGEPEIIGVDLHSSPQTMNCLVGPLQRQRCLRVQIQRGHATGTKPP